MAVPWSIALPAAYFCAMSLLYALEAGASAAMWATETAAYLLLYVAISSYCLRMRDWRPLLMGVVVAGMIVCIEGAIRLFMRGDSHLILTLAGLRRSADIPHPEFRMGYGELPYSNAFATIIIVFASVSLTLAAGANTLRKKILWSAAFAVNLVGIALTGSRGGLIFLAIMALAHAAKNTGAWRTAALAAAGIFAAVVGKLLSTPGSLLRGSGSMRARFHMWRVCLRIARYHPFTGSGPDGFRLAWNQYAPLHGYAARYDTPDGLYADVLCVGGLPMLFATLIAIVGTMWHVYGLMTSKASRTAKDSLFGLSIGLLTTLAHNVVESSFRQPAMYLVGVLLAGMMTAMSLALNNLTTEATIKWSGGSYRSG